MSAHAYIARCDECGAQVPLYVGDLAQHLPDQTADDGGCGGALVFLGPAVWVLWTHSPDGDQVTLHATEASARTALVGYCQQAATWVDGTDDEGTLAAYYDEHTEESYDLTMQVVQP